MESRFGKFNTHRDHWRQKKQWEMMSRLLEKFVQIDEGISIVKTKRDHKRKIIIYISKRQEVVGSHYFLCPEGA